MGGVFVEDIISNRRVLTALNNVFLYGMSVISSEKKTLLTVVVSSLTVIYLFSLIFLAIRFHTFPFDDQQCIWEDIYPAVLST